MPRRRNVVFTVALAFGVLIAAGRAFADERILRFADHVAIHDDGSLTVEETLRVRSEGDQIRRGIYRDFPTTYRDRLGRRYVVGFSVLEVLRAGHREPYHLGHLDNGVRVYIGEANVFLPPGEYTYQLTYQTDRQLGFFDDHDELYWNVTGNGWAFPIDGAVATVTLPRVVSMDQLRVDAFTGLQGQTGKQFRASIDPDGTVRFQTTRPLGPREGLTIVVGWPKGVVTPPTTMEILGDSVHDNSGLLVGLIGLAVLMLYYLKVWSDVGRDPKPGSIMPMYEPPQSLSPAAVRYLRRMGFDHKTLASAIIDMAVKGHLRIDQDGDDYVLARKTAQTSGLTPEEVRISDTLFARRDLVALEQEQYRLLQSVESAAKQSLRRDFERRYFVTNREYFVPGLVLSILTVVAAACLQSDERGAHTLFAAAWLGVWTMGVVFLLSLTWDSWRRVFEAGVAKWPALGRASLVTLFALLYIAAESFGIQALNAVASHGLWIVLVLMALINVVFYRLLRAFTPAGRALMDQLEGLRLYLAAVEQPRWQALNPPTVTPEVFERLLPYALAMDVEEAWSKRLTVALAVSGAAAASYAPNWYSGSSWDARHPGRFGESLSHRLSGAISSASTAPGSSSGFSGGSSGGGGGGGGGGGW